ncbi:MAG: heparinase II/III family protein, partial [Candidatus Omnitrophica bacterium]|nr:heparinase II/III family protein [Candidatus Omnitrophota bacterium]
HLFKDLSAMLMLSACFEGPTSERWFHSASQQLEREIDKQVLSDGGHYERSPMYHILVLGDLLDVRDLLQTVRPDWVAATLAPAIERMAHYLDRILHPDGEIPFFNDSVFNQAPSPALALKRAGLNRSEPNPLDLCEETGVARFAQGALTLLFDCGKLGPDELMGHVHNDSLSIEVSVGGRRMMVNRGVFEYTLGTRRHESRSIHSHNTPCLDNLEQSEIWSSFRVGDRWHPRGPVRGPSHDTSVFASWTRPGMPTIGRTVQTIDSDTIEVIDEFVGDGSHMLSSPFHFVPGILLTDEGAEEAEGRRKWRLRAVLRGAVLILVFDLPSSLTVRMEETTWSPRFYVEERIQKLLVAGPVGGSERVSLRLEAVRE